MLIIPLESLSHKVTVSCAGTYQFKLGLPK